MPSIVYKEDDNGNTYAYEVISYWDKNEKKAKKKWNYLGKPTATGEIKKDKDIKKENSLLNLRSELILDFGTTFIIDEHLKQMPFYNMLKEIFKEDFDTLMSLVCFKLQTSAAFKYANSWQSGNYSNILYKKANMASQRISEFLDRIGKEELNRLFFNTYLTIVTDGTVSTLIDSTGIPNQINFDLKAWSKHSGTLEEETRLLYVIDRKTKMPIFYRYMAGNIIDVSTLTNTILELKEHSITVDYSIVDAGYYSEDNIKLLYRNNISFLTRLPYGRSLYKDIINKHSKNMEKAEYCVTYGKRVLYIKKINIKLFGFPGYAYVILDIKRNADETSKYILRAKEDKLSNETIDEELNNKGKLIFISNEDIRTDEILELYYTRQRVENIFGSLKSVVDLLPVRVHNIDTFRGYLLLNFISLIVELQLQNNLVKKHTIDELIYETNKLKCKVYDDKVLVMEENKITKEILKLLNIKLDPIIKIS